MFSASVEDYIKYIYELQSKGSKVNTSSLALKLNVSPASVSEMISKLSKPGWIKNTPYRGFSLTDKGEKIAVNLIRKHRLIEVFLHQHLGYNWDEVHVEAEKFEHVCTDKFINKLDEYLGYPKFDPHGDPIPDMNGNFSDKKNLMLCNAAPNKYYLVRKVNDTSDEVLRYISAIGIELSTEIFLSEKISFDESVLITINGTNHFLSRKIAENIFVEEPIK